MNSSYADTAREIGPLNSAELSSSPAPQKESEETLALYQEQIDKVKELNSTLHASPSRS